MDKKCLYLKACAQDVICKASLINAAPGTFAMNVYCTKEDHYRCPVLLARTLRDGYIEWAVKAGAVLSR